MSYDLIFAVGDIHGRSDLLQKMDARIQAEVTSIPHHNAGTFLIGDYVDRGPDSKGVIEYLKGGRNIGGLPTECILGNHDMWMGSAISKFKENHPGYKEWFSHSYILDTLRSYGVSLESVKDIPLSSNEFDKHIPRLMQALVKRVPDDHIEFLKNLSPMNVSSCILCHAGINDNFDINEQKISDVIGGLQGFLDYDYDLSESNFGEATCIVGHTEMTVPYMNHDRSIIDIDTGAWRTGILTAGIVNDGKIHRFIAVTDKVFSKIPVIVDLTTGEDKNNLDVMASWWRDIIRATPDEKPVFCFSDNTHLMNFMKATVPVGKKGHVWTEYLKRKSHYVLMPANHETKEIIRKKAPR